IPARPGFLDLDAVRETVETASVRNKPYAVVLNACPVKRGAKEAPAVAQSRAYLDHYGIPVWSGQISQRAGLVLSLAGGASAGEVGGESSAADEIARLWTAIERAVRVVNEARADVDAMAGRAA